MAILKHKTSKNGSYTAVLDYDQYKHKEDSKTGFYKPILDEYGLLQYRDNYAVCYLNPYGQEGPPDDWAKACVDTNLRYGKNNTKGERKNHEYIISHPESDTPLLTKEMLLEEGKAFVRENLQGYDALIAVHMDTDNYHLHITVNSVRAVQREEQSWMMKDEFGKVLLCETKAGGKHQNSPAFRRHCQEWLYNYTRDHGLTVEDNLLIEDGRKQQRYQEKHDSTRELIIETASKCRSMPQLQEMLRQEHGIELVLRGSTLTVHLPNTKKGMRLNRLGISMEDLLTAMGADKRIIDQVKQKASIEIEKKKYVEWLRQRRLKNSIRAEDTVADAAELIAGKVASAGRYYRKSDFRELHDLVLQTTYLERDLQTELDKLDRLLDRWMLYIEASVQPEDYQKHGNYIRWCGCDPDSAEDYRELKTQRDVIELQIREAASIRQALLDSAETWKEQNEENRFQYHQEWNLRKEEQLRQELKSVKANRKKLGLIAYNCQKAADRRVVKMEYLKKAEYFRQMWHDRLMREKAIKEELREIKREKRESKNKDRQ